MMTMLTVRIWTLASVLSCMNAAIAGDGAAKPFRITWDENMLTVSASWLPGGTFVIWYLEAFCRSGSTDREWGETVVPHRTTLRVLRARYRRDFGLATASEDAPTGESLTR